MTAEESPPPPDVDVSFVLPTLDEADYLPDALASIQRLETELSYESIVVDGGSDDRTTELAREYGATVLDRPGSGIGRARNEGANRADGEWLAFVDADTRVRPTYLDQLLAFADDEHLAATSSYCRVTGPLRAKAVEVTINHVFPRLDRPILPGFNTVVHRSAFDAVGGFPDVGNEDTAFSRRLGREFSTAYCPAVLVDTSGRRVDRLGLTGTLAHYGRLDWHRLLHPGSDSRQ